MLGTSKFVLYRDVCPLFRVSFIRGSTEHGRHEMGSSVVCKEKRGQDRVDPSRYGSLLQLSAGGCNQREGERGWLERQTLEPTRTPGPSTFDQPYMNY